MKPNFALSLSFEGIRLLHRTGSGPAAAWSLVGEVAIDAPDLTSQLAMLRKTGLALDPQGLRTKLLIPNDQIKYLALDTTRAGDDDVRAALDGTTPYAVSDLTFDYVRGGGRTYIAAIARETLAEAEAFAAEHRFGPVCFAGVPEPFTYIGEPFFGPTSIADRLLGAGQRVERDDVAVACQPKLRKAETAQTVAAADQTALATPPVPVPVPVAVPLILTEAEPASPTPDFGAPKSDATEALHSDLGPPDLRAPEPVRPDAATADAAPLLTDKKKLPDDMVVALTLPRANLAPPDPMALAFAPQDPTLFAAETAITMALPNLPGQSLDTAPFVDVPNTDDHIESDADMGPKTAVIGPRFTDAAAEAPFTAVPDASEDIDAKPSLIPEPVFASRGRTLRADPTDVPAMVQPLPPPLGTRTAGRAALNGDMGPEPVFVRRTEPPVSRPVVSTPIAPTPIAPTPVMQASPSSATEPARPTDQPDIPAFTSRTAMAAPSLTGAARLAAEPPPPRPFNAKLPATAVAPAVTGQASSARPSEAVAATVIPFRAHPESSDGSAATPVSIQTVTLTPAKPAMATRGAPAIAGPAVPAGKAGTFADRHGGAVRPMPKTSPEPDHPQSNIRSGPAAAMSGRSTARGKPRYLALILTLILLASLAAVAAWASYLGPDGLAGLFGRSTQTDVAQTPAEPSPLTVSDLTATTLVPPADFAAPTTATPAPDAAPEVAALPELAAPEGTADAVAAVPPEAVAIIPQPPASPPTGAAVSPAEADRIYAATGVWLRAPRLPLIPTADPVGSLSRAALDNGVDPVVQPVMPALAGAAPDQSMLTPVDPPAPGTVFQRDANGFVLATPEGTLTPDGILVYAGTPALVPPNRPGTPEPVAEPQVAPQIIAASAPPLAPRPATVVADPTATPLAQVAATAGAVGLGSLGPVVRPLQRPENLAPETAQPDTLIETPVLAAFAGPAPQLRPFGLTPETVALPTATATPDALADPNLAVEDTVAAILAATPPEPITSDSPLAVASARLPEARPQNFAEVVASAQQRSAPAEPQNPSLAVIDPPPEPPAAEPTAQPVPEAAPEQPAAQPELLPESAIADETIAPSGPIPGGVAANATLAEVMDLRAVNLIGVFGRPNDRRALVRLANGRYVRVGVGDSLDGGQVAAIGDNALNYVKRGQTITIAIPNG